MFIVDAQVHIWGADTAARRWPPRTKSPHRPVPFSADDLLREMDDASVDRCIIIPPSWEGARNDLALEAARLHPERFAVVGRLDLNVPNARTQIARWRCQPGMLGMRFSFSTPSKQVPLIEGRIDWLWDEAEKAGVRMMLTTSHAGLYLVDRVAERHPGLKIIIDHFALLNVERDEKAFSDLDKLLALAKRPNIAVKASALPCYTSDSYPYRTLHPHIRRVYDAFGRRRMFWGTDLTRLPCSYRQGITSFTEEIPWLTSEDQEWIMGRGVCEWLAWPVR